MPPCADLPCLFILVRVRIESDLRFAREGMMTNWRVMVPTNSRRRQPLLFLTPGPWTQRFGDGFFKELPVEPGVYFFRAADGQLLYIGQSQCLRTRIRSYRQADPERNPRRTLRLIRRTFRIEWEICGNAADAVAREALLLREHRPPFNRAGVWMPPDSGMRLRLAEGRLEMELVPAFELTTEGKEELIGPLPGRFRRAFVPLARCLFQSMHPTAGWWEYPAGLLRAKPASSVGWRLPEHFEAPLAEMRSLLKTGVSACPWLTGQPDCVPGPVGSDGVFWQEQWEAIAAFQQALQKRRASALVSC